MAIEVADRIYRLGASLVNWWLVEDGGRITLIDAGTPSQYSQLPDALAAIGRTAEDVEAIVLTHAHGDHYGSAPKIRDETGATVHVHSKDLALARGDVPREFERRMWWDLRHGFAWRTLFFFARNGMIKVPPIFDLATFTHGATLDVPGRPRVIHTPGHTDGSACLELADREAIFTGDSLVTINLVTGERGPRVMPGSSNKNSVEALESLNELKGSSAELILPGHGEPWHGSVEAAVTLAHQTGPS